MRGVAGMARTGVRVMLRSGSSVKSREVRAIVGATVLAGALLVVPMAAAPAAAPEPQQQAGCPTTSAADGAARTWVGTPTAALVRAADRLQQLADDHPGSVSGVAFCPDYTGVEILVKDGAGSVAAKIHEVAARDPQQLIYVRFVQRSLDDLLKEQRRILEEAESAGVPVTGVSPDILNDGLVVSVESRDLEAGEVRSSDEALQRSHLSNRLEDPEASPLLVCKPPRGPRRQDSPKALPTRWRGSQSPSAGPRHRHRVPRPSHRRSSKSLLS